MLLMHCRSHNLDGSIISYAPNSPTFGHEIPQEPTLTDGCSRQWAKAGLEKTDTLRRTVMVRTCLDSGILADCNLDNALNSRICFRNEQHWNFLLPGRFNRKQARQALDMYREMLMAGAEPNSSTFVALLEACSFLRDLESTKQLHAHVVRRGYDSDVNVCTQLVDVYAKCSSLVDAELAFWKMPRRDVVSWNAMISAYARLGEVQCAMHFYAKMQQEGVVPDQRTYVGILKSCSYLAGSVKSRGSHLTEEILETVRKIHAKISEGKFHVDVVVGNLLVDVYGKCGSLKDARCVFEAMPYRTVVSWNTIILGYARINQGEEAVHLYTQMQLEGMQPDDRTFVSVLRACSSLAETESRNKANESHAQGKHLERIRSIHRDVKKRHFESDVFVGTMLVDAYSKCESLEDARRTFDTMPHRSVVSWNAMMWGYARMDKGEMALQLYTIMRQEGVTPNYQTYTSALKACSSIGAVEEVNGSGGASVRRRCLEIVRAIHKDVLKGNFKLDLVVGNMLVDAYGKCGSLEDASCVFDQMPHRNVVSWNVILSRYAQVGKAEEVFQLYRRMQHDKVVPDGWTYVSLLKACCSLGGSEKAHKAERKLAKVTGLKVLTCIHANVSQGKFESNVFVANMLVDAYAKCENMEASRCVFERMPCRTVVSWNAIILGYTENDEGEEALKMYKRMEQEGVVSDDRTYVGVLKACGLVTGLNKGKEIHFEIMNSGLESSNIVLSNALIHMYGKCGSMSDAQEVFDTAPERDVVSWSALIAGYSYQGNSEVVFDLFQRMQDEGIQPNGVTFLPVLTVCSHQGLVDTGQKYFKALTDYGISPMITHFTCMIDLHCRSGQVDKAMEIAKAMPFTPDSAVWASILGACQKWKDVELGRQAFDFAIALNKDDAAAYLLMSNIYLAANMVEESRYIQAMREKSQASLQPGHCRWTDTSATVHVFAANDREHPRCHDIYLSLMDLTCSDGNREI